METKNTAPIRGFWMETEPLFPEKKVFNPIVIRPEKGVISMRPDKDRKAKNDGREDAKVIAI